MTVQIPIFTTDNLFPADLLRLELGAQVTPGVSASGEFLVSVSSGLQVQATAGKAYVAQTVSTEGAFYKGIYFCINDATATPFNTITAPISNPRVDAVVLRVYDVIEQSLGGNSLARLEWVTGTETPGANLTNLSGAPTLPANSLLLAYVLQTVSEASISPGNILNVVPVSIDKLALDGVAASGVPNVGDVLTALSATTAGWVQPGFGLSYTPTAANATVTSKTGQLIVGSTGVTVNLHEPAVNDVVAIAASGGVSASNAVTVNAASGNVIFGRGMNTSGQGSFLLGYPTAPVILVAINTSAWLMVAGVQDTGWLPVTPGTDMTQNGAITPSLRCEGSQIRGQGELTNIGGTTLAAGNTLATAAVGTRPAFAPFGPPVSLVAAQIGGSNVGAAAFSTLPSGVMALAADLLTGGVVLLDGYNFPNGWGS